MKSKSFYVPDGLEYFISEEAVVFEKIKASILKTYLNSKYTYVIPPIFDSLDNLLNLKSTDLDSQTTLVLNKSTTNEIGIRADITPQISRVDYQSTGGKGNSKFCYIGDILRLAPGPFDRKNPCQTGVECFGIINKSVDLEIIKLMINIISLSNEKNIVIELGDLSYVNSLINNLSLSTQTRLSLIDLINLKSKHEIKDFFKIYKLSTKKLSLLLDLISLTGDISVLKEVKRVFNIHKIKSTSSLNDLIYLSKGIKKIKNNCNVQIDLCELHGLNYQSSLVYSAYIPSFRKEIARGGRYNAYNLQENKVRYATGFSLDIKDILGAAYGKRNSYV